jgi:hypothetical protein
MHVAHPIVDPRDQTFVPDEMLQVEAPFKTERDADFSRDMVDMVLTEAGKMAAEVLFPALGRDHREAAFYAGKGASARYFIEHVMPEVHAAAPAINSEDLSMIQTAAESFAS